MMKNSTVQLTVKVAADTAEQIKKLANQNHITTAEQIRRFTDKGLQVSGYTQEVDFIAGIIRQELMAVYQLDDIKKLTEHNTDRLAKMLMKIGKINAAGFFLLVKVLQNLANDGSDDAFDQMLTEAVTLGVDYMQKKDFQINSFLQDTDNLRKLADKL